MQFVDWTNRAAALFVCYSTLNFHHVCYAIQHPYLLPAFVFDEHSRWQYGRSFGSTIGFNVTKVEQLGQIAQWMEGIPEDVNYQIILFLDSDASSVSDRGPLPSVEDVTTFLKSVFGDHLIRVHP